MGRQYDEEFLADLPAGVDLCGERGEFHTFCYQCPEISREIPVTVGDLVERDGFSYADLQAYDRPDSTIGSTGAGKGSHALEYGES